MRLALVAVIWTAPLILSGQTTVRFDWGKPEVGPFPNDLLTTFDLQQKTLLRVNLPNAPACTGSKNVSCDAVKSLLNQLDGFSLNPQLRVCFSGPINPKTLKDGIGLVSVSLSPAIIGIDQVLYDEKTKCMVAKPARVLDQSTRHLLVITNRVLDKAGNPLKQDSPFKSCLQDRSSTLCGLLNGLLDKQLDTDDDDARAIAGIVGRIVGASLFTTMSATDWMQKARRDVNFSPYPPVVLPAGTKNVFDLASISSWQWYPQIGLPSTFDKPVTLPLEEQLRAVEKIAFGLYLSPNYLQTSGAAAGSIPPAKTGILQGIGNPIPVPGLPPDLPPGYVPISFHVFLPRASNAKIPVVLYGHGLSDNQFGAPTAIASTLANAGFATLAFEEFGHGFGPSSYVKVLEKGSPQPQIMTTPGRGIPFPDGTIGATNGCILLGPLATRDCTRQTAVDVLALVRAIKGNGLGLNLDPSRIYYVGQSFGSLVGTLVHAVEPDLKAALFNGGADSAIDVGRLSFGHALADLYINDYNKGLYTPTVAALAKDPTFDFFYAYRGDVQINPSTAPKGLDIQTAFDVADWLNMPGAPGAFAPHLQDDPLNGMPGKPTLVQFGWGDLEVPNSTESGLARAIFGSMAGGNQPLPLSYFRFDAALGTNPRLATIMMPGFPLPILPHRLLANPTLFDPVNADEKALSQVQQNQAVDFFRSGGVPSGLSQPPYFEQPKFADLPAMRNYGWIFPPH